MKQLVLVCALALAACNKPAPLTGVKVIVGAKLLSAADRPPIEYSVVVIENGKFREVGPQALIPVPKGAEIIAGLGMTIEPPPNGNPIEPGRPADLILRASEPVYAPGKETALRIMHNGEWIP
jgi:imidazolonepropionase-like amidohydrolase